MFERTITKIEYAPVERQRQTRVAAYCRVSSLRESQLTSLKAQRIHYESLIAERPDWIFTDIYYEEGLSGTRKETRPELMRLLSDCEAGKIDLVLTKSISRFARNTTDCLEMVRAMTGLGVEIYFEKEKMRTGKAESELILAVLASLAEFESRAISGNELWALEKRCQKGSLRLSRPPYGYQLQDGRLVIDPAEAEIVLYIYDCVLEGKGTPTIAVELNRRQVPTKRGGTWHPGTLRKMLSNAVYTGDLLLKKTWRDDNYRCHPNRGEVDQFYIQGDHEAIISKDVFEAAAGATRQRGREAGSPPAGAKGEKDSRQNRYCFTGKIICGCCGAAFRRQRARCRDGCQAFWACKTHLKSAAACPMGRVREETLQHLFLTMLGKLTYSRMTLLLPYIRALEEKTTKIRNLDIDQVLQENGEYRRRLGIYYSMGRMDPAAFRKAMAELTYGNSCLRREKKLPAKEDIQLEEAKKLYRFLNRRPHDMAEFFPEDFSAYVDHVLVHSPDQLSFYLKCGLILDEKAQ